MGVRGMCATSGGGLALMTEAIGMAGMIETPVVVVNVMRAGPSTGVPTKTEQADLNQAFGASQGDFPRIVSPRSACTDCFKTPALAFNLAERYQCPVIILADLLMCEDNETVDPALLDVDFKIDRGELITRGERGMRRRRTVSALQGHAIGHLAASDSGPAGPSLRVRHRRARRGRCADQRRVHRPGAAQEDGRQAGPQDGPRCSITCRRRSWKGRPRPR